MNASKTEAETAIQEETKTESDSTAVIAEFVIPVAEFALGETLAALDGVRFEGERVVAHSADRFMPLIWVSGSEPAGIEPALADDPSVAAFDLLAHIDEENESEALYRMEWTGHIDALTHLFVGEGATLLDASTTNGRWRLRSLFSDHVVLARTYENCERMDLPLDVAKIYNLDEGQQGRFGLTDGQHQALLVAFEHGYYEIPREVMAQDLAEGLGVSHQALSERLRRAHGHLVESAIRSGATE